MRHSVRHKSEQRRRLRVLYPAKGVYEGDDIVSGTTLAWFGVGGSCPAFRDIDTTRSEGIDLVLKVSRNHRVAASQDWHTQHI